MKKDFYIIIDLANNGMICAMLEYKTLPEKKRDKYLLKLLGE